jgi:hypothetical protein
MRPDRGGSPTRSGRFHQEMEVLQTIAGRRMQMRMRRRRTGRWTHGEKRLIAVI